MIITAEMLFENNVKQIIEKIVDDYHVEIQRDFDKFPNQFVNLLSWLELHPKIVGEYFFKHIINYGFTDEDIN